MADVAVDGVQVADGHSVDRSDERVVPVPQHAPGRRFRRRRQPRRHLLRQRGRSGQRRHGVGALQRATAALRGRGERAHGGAALHASLLARK